MKKGFTLIELLAVIVILAIIALIAVPIVLSIISDSKESASLRSAEMYLDAVEYGIADKVMDNKTIPNGKYSIIENGNICIGTYSNKVCTGDIIEVEVNGEVPKEGSTITIEEGKIKGINLLYGDKTIIKNSEGNLAYAKELSDICKYQNNGIAEKTAGALYSCEVKPGTSYNFYVLTTPVEGDITINLIMDTNICEDGTPTDATKAEKCLVAYNSSGNSTGVGPVTAMTYLNNATSSWENIDNLDLIYDDEAQNFTGFILNGKARMPYYSELSSFNNSNGYLFENLAGGYWDFDESKKPNNIISGINGYWALSSYIGDSSKAYRIDCSGYIGNSYVDSNSSRGVRAVINLKI